MKKNYLAVALFICAGLFNLNQLHANEAASHFTAAESLARLKEGNLRYVENMRLYPRQDSATRLKTYNDGQYPYVTILSCADSRVPLEHIFDAGTGDLFVIRVAGNVADTDEIGTIEYGAGHLKTPLVLVLGHTKCGAVTAVAKGDKVHGALFELVENIIPAVERARKKLKVQFTPELVDEAIRENVWQSIEDLLEKSGETSELVKEGKLQVVGGIYHLDTGLVEWIGEHPDQKNLLSTEKSGEHGNGKDKFFYFVVIVTVLICFYMVCYLLILNSHTRFSSLRIRSRIMLAFVTDIFGLLGALTPLYITNSGEKTHPELFWSSCGLVLVIALIYGLGAASAIIGSFEQVVAYLKNQRE